MKVNFSTQFEALAAQHGEREALVNVERGRRYTFRELHLLTNRIAQAIRHVLGLGEGDFFLTILKNDNASLLHFPTIFKQAATGCFANYRDSIQTHLAQLDQCGARAVFIENALIGSYLPELRQRGVTVVCMDPVPQGVAGVLYFWDLIEQASDASPNVELDDRSHVAVIRFTGGTTGKSKAAALSLDNWFGSRDSVYSYPGSDFGPHVRMLHLAPISHGSALLVLPAFCSGGCTLTLNEPDLAAFCQTVERERVTHTMAVPTILYRLLDMPEAAEADLSSLSTVVYGAAPMSAAKLKALLERFGSIFLQAYGSTEVSAFALVLNKGNHRIDTPLDEKRLASAGLANPLVELIIADDNGVPVAQGEVGEIWMRTRATVSGYYNDPKRTAEEFANGFWKSGDMARMDEQGYVYIVDRKKDVIISGGFNIYAVEIEGVLDSHPAVLMSAVFGVPHDEWGEAVYAEVVMREGTIVTADELTALVATRLGKFKAPKHIAFANALPMSAAGKILRREIRERYWLGRESKVN